MSLRLLDKALAAVKRPEDGHVAKALRASSTMLDVRMLISQPDPNNWLGRGDKAETGGFELRRKDWPLVSLPALTQGDWNRRTLYVVRPRLALRHRTRAHRPHLRKTSRKTLDRSFLLHVSCAISRRQISLLAAQSCKTSSSHHTRRRSPTRLRAAKALRS